MTVIEEYKRFRNKVRKLDLSDTLYLIWLKSNYNQFDIPLPNDFDIILKDPKNLNHRPSKMEIMLYNGLDFELEAILLESLYSSGYNPHIENSLRNGNILLPILRDLRNVDNAVYKEVKSQGDVFLGMQRVIHQQFLWQEKLNGHSLFQYYYIYNDPNMSTIIEEKIGLTPYEIFTLGIYFTFKFQRFYWLEKEHESSISPISTETITKFIDTFSTSIPELITEVHNTLKIDTKVLYTFNPLRANPIVKIKDKIIAPMPILIYWQITKGLYYRLCNHRNFSNAFGLAFHNSIGEIFNRAISNKKIKVIEEFEYFVSKSRKDSVDWIIEDKNENLFIECKTKRITRKSQFSFEVEEMKSDIDTMVDILEQVYLTYLDYAENYYTKYPFNKKLKTRLLVLTLESWHLELNITVFAELKNKVKKKLIEKGKNESVVDRIPYYIMSTSSFQSDIQLINKIGLQQYLKLYDTRELPDFRNNSNLINLFDNDFESVFIAPLKNNGG